MVVPDILQAVFVEGTGGAADSVEVDWVGFFAAGWEVEGWRAGGGRRIEGGRGCCFFVCWFRCEDEAGWRRLCGSVFGGGLGSVLGEGVLARGVSSVVLDVGVLGVLEVLEARASRQAATRVPRCHLM